METVYEECLCYELCQRGLSFKRQVHLPVFYKGAKLDCGYKMDVVVENQVILELKAVDALLPIHAAQLLTYLKLSGKRVGLLLNFNEPVLKKGIKRLVNHFQDGCPIHVTSAPSALVADPQEMRPQSSINPKNSASPRLRGEFPTVEP